VIGTADLKTSDYEPYVPTIRRITIGAFARLYIATITAEQMKSSILAMIQRAPEWRCHSFDLLNEGATPFCATAVDAETGENVAFDTLATD